MQRSNPIVWFIRLVVWFIRLAVLTLTVATPASAWNNAGHEVVAYLAYEQLTPAARGRANELLELNPSYSAWVNSMPAGTSAADRDRLVFLAASTWPDQIKSNSAYHNDGSHNGNLPPTDGTADNNIGYSDFARHKYWHYIDVPFSTDSTPLPPIPTSNAQARIAAFRDVLASNASDELKSYDLSWLLHLVGDIHQPLHAATRATSEEPNGDDGGNGVKLDCSGCPTNLHSLWDGSIAKNAPSATLIAFADMLPSPDPTLAAVADEAVWVDESFNAARTHAYIHPVGEDSGPFVLSDEYRDNAKAIAKGRAVLAGARLAALLNTAFAADGGEPDVDEIQVFTNPHGVAYHLESCRYTGPSSRQLSIGEAKAMGRHACGVCKPPS